MKFERVRRREIPPTVGMTMNLSSRGKWNDEGSLHAKDSSLRKAPFRMTNDLSFRWKRGTNDEEFFRTMQEIPPIVGMTMNLSSPPVLNVIQEGKRSDEESLSKRKILHSVNSVQNDKRLVIPMKERYERRGIFSHNARDSSYRRNDIGLVMLREAQRRSISL